MSDGPPLRTSHHPRTRGANRYVYLVRSRRAGGLSIGVNLDPQKTCNFDCVYCEVIDRRDVARRAGRPAIVVEDVADELRAVLQEAEGTGRGVELRDIAYAGDGEPSTFPGFLGLSLGLTFGIAAYPEDAFDTPSLVARAEEALDDAVKIGRGTIVLYGALSAADA